MSDAPAQLDWPVNEPPRTGDEYLRYAEVYDILFGDIDDDAAFYLGCASSRLKVGGAVLELGTGTGRVAARFLGAGYSVTGVDASAEMLARSERKLGSFAARYRAVHADVRVMELEEHFALAVAPYGMVAHLLTDDDRLATFRRVHAHLKPGGIFVFDDMPAWLGGRADGSRLDLRRTGFDAVAGMPVRLQSNCIDVAGTSLSVRYDFVDWMDNGSVARRLVIRVVFRNIALEDELALLADAGFEVVEILGTFDGTPFDRSHLTSNHRLIISCRRRS